MRIHVPPRIGKSILNEKGEVGGHQISIEESANFLEKMQNPREKYWWLIFVH